VLDAVATWSPTRRKAMLSVVNRSPDTDVTAELDVRGPLSSGEVSVQELNAIDWHTVNTFDRPDAVSVATTTGAVPAGTWRHRFPAHSLTVITLT
jgi:alpha-L-arabinofuranosidase